MPNKTRIRSLLPAAGIVFACAMPGAAHAGSESRAFFADRIYTERPPLCLKAGTGCGKAAADQWCQLAGYEAAMSYSSAPQISETDRQKRVEVGSLCSLDTCNGFQLVKCRRDTVDSKAGDRKQS